MACTSCWVKLCSGAICKFDRFSKLGGHGLHIIFVQAKFERDLLVTEVQTHEVQA
jgi:hypothetical protein